MDTRLPQEHRSRGRRALTHDTGEPDTAYHDSDIPRTVPRTVPRTTLQPSTGRPPARGRADAHAHAHVSEFRKSSYQDRSVEEAVGTRTGHGRPLILEKPSLQDTLPGLPVCILPVLHDKPQESIITRQLRASPIGIRIHTATRFPLLTSEVMLKLLQVPFDDFRACMEIFQECPAILDESIESLCVRACVAYQVGFWNTGDRILQRALLIRLCQIWRLGHRRSVMFMKGLTDETSGKLPPRRLQRFKTLLGMIIYFFRLNYVNFNLGSPFDMEICKEKVVFDLGLRALIPSRVRRRAILSHPMACQQRGSNGHPFLGSRFPSNSISRWFQDSAGPSHMQRTAVISSAYSWASRLATRPPETQSCMPHFGTIMEFLTWLQIAVFPQLARCYLECQKRFAVDSNTHTLPRDSSICAHQNVLSFSVSGNPGGASSNNQGGRKRGREQQRMSTDDQDKPLTQTGSVHPRKRPRVQSFACHFHKLDPLKFASGKYKSCPNAYDGLNRLKQHQKYVHMPLYYCKRCKTIYKMQDEKDRHDQMPQKCVEVEDPDFDDYLTLDSQRRVLNRKRADPQLTDASHWFEIWDAFFPWAARPMSPYKEEVHDELSRYISFAELQTTAVVERFWDTHPEMNSADVDLHAFFHFAIHHCQAQFSSLASPIGASDGPILVDGLEDTEAFDESDAENPFLFLDPTVFQAQTPVTPVSMQRGSPDWDSVPHDFAPLNDPAESYAVEDMISDDATTMIGIHSSWCPTFDHQVDGTPSINNYTLSSSLSDYNMPDANAGFSWHGQPHANNYVLTSGMSLRRREQPHVNS